MTNGADTTGVGAEVSFILTKDEIDKYEVAASEIEYLLGAAGNIFDLLQSSISLGQLDLENAGVIAMIEMVGRGFIAAADKEGIAMTQLGGKLRNTQPIGRDLT